MERKVIEVHLSHFVTELYLLVKCKVHLSNSINHYAFGKSVVVLVYMIARFLLFPLLTAPDASWPKPCIQPITANMLLFPPDRSDIQKKKNVT